MAKKRRLTKKMRLRLREMGEALDCVDKAIVKRNDAIAAAKEACGPEWNRLRPRQPEYFQHPALADGE